MIMKSGDVANVKDEIEMFDVYVGYFEGVEFVWKKLKSFNKFEDGYRYFKKFANELIAMSDDEVIEKYNSGRVDVELKHDDKNINWFGINISVSSSDEL